MQKIKSSKEVDNINFEENEDEEEPNGKENGASHGIKPNKNGK
jgi:hypothetical protein